jgi:hypothetical protein
MGIKERYSKEDWDIQIKHHQVWRHPDNILARRRGLIRVSPSYRCNRSCEFCFASGLAKQFPEDMTSGDFSKVLDWARSNGCHRVRLLGGEPTQHPDFKGLLNACREKNFLAHVFTNALFVKGLPASMDPSVVQEVTVNYPFAGLAGGLRKEFDANVMDLHARGLHLGFAGVLPSGDVNAAELEADFKRYTPHCLWVSLPLPGFSGQVKGSEVFEGLKSLLDKVLVIQDVCIRLHIPFFVLRPMPACLFKDKAWSEMREILPFLIHTRCPLGYSGNYSSMLMVNPDLSVFPCTNVFEKGPSLLSFRDWEAISKHYERSVKSLLCKPAWEACRNCGQYRDFCASLETNKPGGTASLTQLCQGGCLGYHCAS